ncbi:MAG TPA: ABC transporter substrate-binding protein [Acetobacteraceae bacterium]|nr:ABC transporter substrate-binding protein [Acetobacteraceae bacterium]
MLTRRTLLASTAALGAAGLDLPGARAATPPGVVVMAKQIDDVISFDPAESYEFTDNETDGNCYRKLIVPDAKDPNKIAPDLAERWEVSPDGMTFTFHLTEKAKFGSGKPVTAADAEFTFHRVVQRNKTPAFIITQFGYTKDNVEKLIRATAPNTLVMELPTKQAPSFVLYCLSANVGCIVEKAAALANQQNGDLGNGWLKTHTAGAGPFKLTSWQASDHIIVDANPGTGERAGVKRVVLQHVKDPAEQLLLLQKGGVDIARDLLSDQLKVIAGNPAFHIVEKGQANQLYIAMNQSMPELAKPEVHQAIKWAIDYQAIAKNITPQTWSVQQSFLPRGIPGALTEQPFDQDLGRARTLMGQAGLQNGFSCTMDFISAPPFDQIAQAVQADLSKIGIKVQLLPGEQKQVITKTRARQHQLAMLVWGSDYFDPNSNAQAFCANPDDSDNSKLKILAWRSHFVNKQLTMQVEDAATELDSKKRLDLYKTMQEEFWDVAPFAMMLQRNAVAAMRKNVTGFELGPMPDFTHWADMRKS